MTPITGIRSGSQVQGKDLSSGQPYPVGLLSQLDGIRLAGRQMFERDCLSFTFDCWARSQKGQVSQADDLISATDVLAEISDIRSLQETYPDEITEVDPELLEAASAIEAYVQAHREVTH